MHWENPELATDCVLGLAERIHVVSIVIPVYNEASILEDTLKWLSGRNLGEVIIVDGGSTDDTMEIAARYPVRIIRNKKGRAAQMNAGAKVTMGDVLLFLHADCRLSRGSLPAVVRAIGNGVNGGCLTHVLDSRRLVYRLIEFSGNVRARLFATYYGDSAIFVRRDVFFKIGGFPEVDLFDDLLFSRRLSRVGHTRVLKEKVHTSVRRWEKQGVVKTTLGNWLVSVGFLLGVSPVALKKLYDDIR